MAGRDQRGKVKFDDVVAGGARTGNLNIRVKCCWLLRVLAWRLSNSLNAEFWTAWRAGGACSRRINGSAWSTGSQPRNRRSPRNYACSVAQMFGNESSDSEADGCSAIKPNM